MAERIPTWVLATVAFIICCTACCLCAVAPLGCTIIAFLGAGYSGVAVFGKVPWRGPRWTAIFAVIGWLIVAGLSGAFYLEKGNIDARIEADRQAARIQQAAEQARREAERREREVRLREEATARLSTIGAQLDGVEAQLTSRNYGGALGSVGVPLGAAQELADLANAPAGAAEAVTRAQANQARAAAFVGAEQAIQVATTVAAEARARATENALHAQQQIDDAASALARVPTEPATVLRNEIARANRDLARARLAIQPHVRRQERELRRLAEQMVRCGLHPDATRLRSESRALMRNAAHDPSSIEVFDCSEAQLDNTRCWTWTCNVRGRNLFGALVLQRRRFQMDASRISVR